MSAATLETVRRKAVELWERNNLMTR